MKHRLIALMLLLNVLALGAGFFCLSRYLEKKAETLRASRPKIAAANARKIRTLKLAPVQPPSLPTVIYVTNAFRWRQLESTDYRKYIANLRSIGCPESTIKDIILTDVMKLYAARRGQLRHNGRDFKFWETDEKRQLRQSQLQEREKQLAQIDKDLPAVLRDLLGINYERELNKYFLDTGEDDRRLAFLSEDKRSQLLALRDQIEGERERVLETAIDGRISAAGVEQLKQIEARRQETLARLLSPEERLQYELSTSETADRLRGELVGFNPSEAEFREIFQRRQALEARYAFQDASDPAVAAARAQDETKLNAEVKTLLGDARATDYDRVQNPDYRDLVALNEEFDLPASTTQTLLDIRDLAEAERSKLMADKQLPDDARFRALKAIEDETEKTVRQTLGEKAYSQYSQNSGAWMRKLGPN